MGMTQAEAGEVVIRILADVNSILKGFKKVNTGAKAVGVILDEVGKQIAQSIDKGTKAATDSIEQFVSNSKAKLKTLSSEFREVGRDAARAFRRASMPREGGRPRTPGSKRVTRYGMGGLPVESKPDRYQVNKQGRYYNTRTGRIVKRSVALAGELPQKGLVTRALAQRASARASSLADRMLGRSIPKGSMNAVGQQTDGQYAAEQARNAARMIPNNYGSRSIPKNTATRAFAMARARLQPEHRRTNGMVREALERGSRLIDQGGTAKNHGEAIRNAQRLANREAVKYGQGSAAHQWYQREAGLARARAVPEKVVPTGTVTRALEQANTNRLNRTYGPAARGRYGPQMSPEMVAARRGAQAARGVVDRPLDEKYTKRLATARQLGGPLSPMPGILGKIAGGFFEASKKKDAFAANVFAKMPPCFMMFMNVAKGVYKIGAWGFQKAWSGAKLFTSALVGIPNLVMKMGSAVSRAFNSISQRIGAALGKLQALGTKLRTAGMYTTAAITAPLVGLGVGTVAEGADFDKSMTETVARAGTDAGGKRKIDSNLRAQLEQAAISLSTGGTTSFSPTELARGYTELAAAGVEAAALLTALPVAAALAQAGQLDLANATNALTTTMGALGITTASVAPAQYAQEMKKYGDVMVTVANLTQASVESVAQSMTSDAGPAAAAYGMKIEELGALIGVYAEKGIKGAKAGNMAGRALRLVTASFAKNRGAWARAGISVTDATGKFRPFMDVIDDLNAKMQGMSDIQKTDLLRQLGLRDLSQKSITPLLGARKEYNKLLNEMKRRGATTRMAAIQMEAFSNQIKVMWNNLSAVKIDLFKILAPYLLAAAKAVSDMAQAFTSLGPDTKKSIILVLSALATIGPILLGLGTMIAVVVAGFSMFGFLLAPIALLLSPIGIVVAAIAVLGAMFLSTFKIDIAGMWVRASVALNNFAAFAMMFLNNFGPNMDLTFKWVEGILKRFSAWSAETLAFIAKSIDQFVLANFPKLHELFGKLFAGGEGFFAGAGAFFDATLGFVTNFAENMQNIFTWMGANWAEISKVIQANLLIVLGAVGTVLISIMAVVGQELLKAMVPIGTFLWNLFKGVALFLYDTLRGVRFNPTTMGFEMIDRKGLAKDKYEDTLARINREDPRTTNFGRFRSAEWKKQQAIKTNIARAQAQADYQEELRGIDGGERLVNETLKTATDAMDLANQTNPVNAIGAVVLGGINQAQQAMQAIPNLQQLNLNLAKPAFQGPGFGAAQAARDAANAAANNAGFNPDMNLSQRIPVGLDAEGNTMAAHDTGLFEKMVVALQAMNLRDSKVPVVKIAPAGIA